MNTYISYQLIARDIPKAIDRIERQPIVDRETKYYLDNIGKVSSIDEFVKNDRLFKYAMKAFGLQDMSYAKAFMVKALKEGVTDPDSFANKLTDKRYAEFVAAFNFAKYGEEATVYSQAKQGVVKNFALQFELGPVQEGFTFAEAETSYFLANVTSVKSIDDLMGNERLLDYAMTAFGLDAETESPDRIRQMLEGGISDSDSPANRHPDKRYAKLVAAFDFAAHGDQATLRDEVLRGVPKAFMDESGLLLIKTDADHIAAEATYYAQNISKVTSISDLLSDRRLLTVAMAAFGLDADAESPQRIREMLAGGIADPASPANKETNKRYAAFVKAFNFAEYGAATTSRPEVLQDTGRFYVVKSELGLSKPSNAWFQAETAYYQASIGKVRSVDDLMADKRLYNYAIASFGLDPDKEDRATIRKVLERGEADPASFANKTGDKRYIALAKAFDFTAHGEGATTYNASRQDVVDKYMRQTLEEDAGNSNEGVRLALYFERKAAGLTNWYEVLADKALATVVRTAFGLPESFAAADIDRQVKLFESKMKIEDFTDPAKLATFMTRFTSLYEINNPTSPALNAASILFAQPTTMGVSTNLLMAMQQLRSR
ncbi:DUF1217 domain-containing protein [Aquamicrobium terrae]|uniref:DUF1217 domain-containing protein n=1 Tax=Aquamicrobium terrae TaxID=1324945 RepID=A0ABV2N0L9_9HYPH